MMLDVYLIRNGMLIEGESTFNPSLEQVKDLEVNTLPSVKTRLFVIGGSLDLTTKGKKDQKLQFQSQDVCLPFCPTFTWIGDCLGS